MKTFKQFTQESLDSQYDFRDRGYEEGKHIYDFDTKDKKDKIKVNFDHDDEYGEAEISFRDKEGSLDATGNKGTEAVKVFSTVHKIIQRHAAKHPHIKTYRFMGSEGSRSRLYDRLVNKVGGTSDHLGYVPYKEYTVPADRLRGKKKKK